MPNTSEGFYYPDANTNIAPLETVLANMAASSDSVARQTPRVFANYAAMVAGIPSPVGGRLAITTQGSGILWQYDGTAAKWVVQNRPAFSDATARNAAIPFPTVGIVAVTGSGASMAEYRWDGTAWKGRLLDSGWLDITPGAGFTAVAGAEPKVRVVNGVPRYKGSLRGNITSGVASSIGTVPAGARPADVWETAVPTIETAGRTLVYAYIADTGVITVVPTATIAPGTVSLVPLGGYLASA